MIPALIGALAGPVSNIISEFIEDPDEKNKARARIESHLLANQAEIHKAASSVILAEARGESWLQRNWRPMLMCLFGYIVAHNYVLSPLFDVASVAMPEDLWDLLKLGVGGYVVGRTVEKSAKNWKQGE